MLQTIVEAYLKIFPAEKDDLDRLVQLIAEGEKLNDRRNFRGHVTGSGIVLSADRSKVLLIHHKSFNRWQQPGGHWETDEEADPLVVARREVTEETGVAQLEYLPVDATQPLVPIDIDSHEVPARPHKDEPDHWHHDFRYVFIAQDEVLTHQKEEVTEAGWFDFDAPETFMIRPIIDKLRHFGFIS